MTALLTLDGVSKSFRGLKAVSHVSLAVEEGRITSLIGPNGAGKTTLFNLIAGAIRPDAGRIVFAGQDVAGQTPDRAARRGIARTFQIVKPFAHLSVEENVLVGALCREVSVTRARVKAREIAHLLGLSRKLAAAAAGLTLPERKRLEVARALATGPRLLLLDECMAGLRPSETEEMVCVFQRLNRETGLTILLTEHVMRAVMALSHQVFVLHHGEIIGSGAPDAVVRDPRVIESYLGTETVG
ncbi:MAG: ABC transporter ATP-binding protein [Parvibaculaceae bacterium]